MYKSLIVAVVLVWANLLGAESSSLPEKYAKLDKWLTDNVLGSARNKIFAQEAKVFLESKGNELNKDEIEAAKLFQRLEDIVPIACSKESVEILEHIAKDVNLDISSDAAQETLVQRIVWRYALSHAKSCMKVYDTKRMDIDSELILEDLFISMMIGELFKQLGYERKNYLVPYEQDSPEMKRIIATVESEGTIELIGQVIRNSWLKFGKSEDRDDFKPKYFEKTSEKYADKIAIYSHLIKTFGFFNRFIEHNKDFLDLVAFDTKVGFYLDEVIYPSLNNKIAKLKVCQAIIKRDNKAIFDEIVKQIMASD